MAKMLGVPEVAEQLGVTPRRVHAMIKTGMLKAKKLARDWFIHPDDLAAAKADREVKRAANGLKGGRPPRSEDATT
jgi:hypothetical protein